MICEKQNNAIQDKRFLKYFSVRKQNVLLCWLTFRNFKSKKDRPPGVKLLLSTTTPDITIMTGSSANVFYDLYFLFIVSFEMIVEQSEFSCYITTTILSEWYFLMLECLSSFYLIEKLTDVIQTQNINKYSGTLQQTLKFAVWSDFISQNLTPWEYEVINYKNEKTKASLERLSSDFAWFCLKW